MRRLTAVASCVLCFASLAAGEVKPNHLFSDHMVLQSGTSVPVWGTAAPGEQVTVTLGDQKQSAAAGPDGKWMVRLSELKAGDTPLEMSISGSNTLTIHDILVGEVWIGSGQSNMEFPFWKSPTVGAYTGVTNMEQEDAAANYPRLRMYSVKTTTSGTELEDTVGQWDVCTPDTVKKFSAIGYFFSRDLQKNLNVPVGFIHSSFGASTAEAWVSKPVMDSNPLLAGLMSDYQKALTAYAARGPAPAPAVAPATAPAPTDATTTQPGARGRGRGRGRGPRGPQDPARNQHNPTTLWNGMIHPLVPYAIRGVIWYQGESVLGGTAGDKLYPTVMESLVTSWRKAWGEGDFPFYVCQLAGQDAASNNPIIRESQAAILNLPNTGMAVTIDIGEIKNVHPKDKQDVGDRLSRIALANVYGQHIEFSGPKYDSMKVEGNAIRINFTHADGLSAKGGDAVNTFVIAGADGKFVPATAKIDGTSVVVSSPDVPAPAAVRYAWANWPVNPNLVNSAGLPAAPFRTDKDAPQ
jgi:sialate O-acetylesterase